jgi:3-phenylpropionate/cinnamic acid dioxygenase small subunit
MEPFELAAREAIRDLVARYNANGDSGRFDAMLALFAEDATFELESETLHGRPAIRAFFERVSERTGPGRSAAFVRHFTATHQIDVLSEREARGRCYYAVLTERGLDHWGRYLDEYRRVGERWLFQRRKVTMDAAVPGGWGAGARASS